MKSVILVENVLSVISAIIKITCSIFCRSGKSTWQVLGDQCLLKCPTHDQNLRYSNSDTTNLLGMRKIIHTWTLLIRTTFYSHYHKISKKFSSDTPSTTRQVQIKPNKKDTLIVYFSFRQFGVYPRILIIFVYFKVEKK